MKKKAMIILGVIAVLALLGAVICLMLTGQMGSWQGNAEEVVQDTEGKTIDEMIGKTEPVPLKFQGKTYLPKKNVKAYLIMGIDRSGKAVPTKNLHAGQADTLVVLAVDHDAKTYTALQLDRDTMMDVEVLSPDGTSVVDVQHMQICLAHTTGTGMEDSCENTVRAVSKLLCHVPINGYVSIMMDSLSILNDAVGGVSVTIQDDFSQDDPTLVMGQTITLDGQQAYHFLRGRMSVGDGTNTSRMRRQREYLQGYIEKLRQYVSEDSGFAISLFQEIQPYMVTDISGKTINELAGTLPKYLNCGFVTIAGEYVVVDDYMEFHVDQQNLTETVLSLFYEEASTDAAIDNVQ